MIGFELARLVGPVAGGVVSFHPDDGLDASIANRVVEMNGAIHGAVVGDGKSVHAVGLAGGGHIFVFG